MTTASKKMGDRGEIVIPKRIREEAGIDRGSTVEIVPLHKSILIIPVRKLSETAGLFKDMKTKNLKELDSAYFEYMST
jgi:AbrB family looped-hinge helix DNA binding protein